MCHLNLFYATAFVCALTRFDPSSMGRPSIVTFSSGDGGRKSGARDKKKSKYDDKLKSDNNGFLDVSPPCECLL